jgi:hypothetical protein
MIYLLFIKDLEYQANRIMAVAWTLAPPVLFGWIRSREEAAVAVAATALLLIPIAPVTAYAKASPSTTSHVDRQVGEWFAALPDSSRILIDVQDNLHVWYSHWPYMEALHRFAGDDRKIVIPLLNKSYVSPRRPPPEKTDFLGVTHIVRGADGGRVGADGEVIASNDRYRLYRVRQPLFWLRTTGFYDLEPSGYARMKQDGKILLQSGATGMKTIRFAAMANPAFGSVRLRVAANGQTAGWVDVQVHVGSFSLQIPVRQGCNDIVLHSEREPAPPGNGDGRLLSVYLGPVSVQ